MRSIVRTLASLLLMAFLGGAANAADEEGAPDIAYFALKPSIVANLTGGPKYIRCDIQLMTEDASQMPKIELHAPALRHDVLMLITGRDGRQLKGRDGKEKLRKEALQAIREHLEALTGKALVDDLYFTAYYVQ